MTYAGRPGGLVSTYNIFPDIQQKEMRFQQAGFPKGYLTERRRPLKMMAERYGMVGKGFWCWDKDRLLASR